VTIDLIQSVQSTPIGGLRWCPESGTDITDGDGTYYLRTGLAVAIGSYTEAATKEHLKVSGIAATNSTAVGVTQVADNGAGTIVACYGHATNVLVSTDYGATWAAVAHALGGGTAVGVVWTGTRFIVSGNTTTNMYTSYSTTGASFTVGTSQAAAATADTARGAWNGAVALFAAAGGTAAAFTTTNGTALTARTLPASLGAPNIIVGGSTFFIVHGSATAYSTSDGSSFTSRTLPATGSRAAYIGALWVVVRSSSTYYTSPDLTTWTAREFPSTTDPGNLTFDSSRAYASLAGAIYWTTDGISWKVRWPSVQAGASGWYCHAGICLLNYTGSTSSTILRIPAWATADYVGTGSLIKTNTSSGLSYAYGYVRLK
jgi:hypothetical protein